MNFKKIASAITSAAFLVSSLASPAFATVSTGTGSATGAFNYDNGTRHATLDAKSNGDCSTTWNMVSDKWVLDFVFNGTHYVHDMNVTNQTFNTFSGTGSYPDGGPTTITWHVTGTVSGNLVTIHITYDNSTYVLDGTATLTSNGMLTNGTWSDNSNQSGTWSSTKGSAAMGCGAKGTFDYNDNSLNSYIVKVSCINVMGNTAIFSGKVTNSNHPEWIGKWLIAKVVDGGPHGIGDSISGDFANTDPMCNPAGIMSGPFPVTTGDIKVKSTFII